MVSSAEQMTDLPVPAIARPPQPEDLPAARLLVHAARLSGRGVFDLAREHLRLKKAPGRLSLQEYIGFGLYDMHRYAPEDQTRFLGRGRRWSLTAATCDLTWRATLEDKWLCDALMERGDVPMASTLAVIDGSMRVWPGTPILRGAHDLRDFLSGEIQKPLFAKPNRTREDSVSFVIEAADRDGVQLRGAGRISYEALMKDVIGRRSYVLQPVLKAHHFFQNYTDALPSVQVTMLITDQGVRMPFAVLRLPGPGQVSDQFDRPGAVACAIDPQDGRITTARSRNGLEILDHQTHPDTGATFAAETIPHWSDLAGLAEEIALSIAPVRFQSMDFAVTSAGPILLGLQAGSDLQVPQFAAAKGALTDEVTAFFRSCGVTDI